jgi:hypothetical protein
MKLTDKCGRLIDLFDKNYVLLMVLVAVFVMKLNWHAQGMQGIILSGSDLSAGKYSTPNFLLFPLTALVTFRRKNLFFILLLSCIAYQGAINMFAYNMASYTANMYFFHLINLSFGLTLLNEYVLRKVISSEGVA